MQLGKVLITAASVKGSAPALQMMRDAGCELLLETTPQPCTEDWQIEKVRDIAALVFAMIALFKSTPSPTMVLLYALAQGIAIGAISLTYESFYNGIILQAVIGTLAVVGVTLALFASGKIRASARATKIFFIVFIAYFVYSIVNVFLMMFGAIQNNPWGMDGIEIFGIPLGVILAPVIILLGAYSLVLDFDMIKQGVANKAPAAFAWTGALSVTITVVWLYMQILRILAIARN